MYNHNQMLVSANCVFVCLCIRNIARNDQTTVCIYTFQVVAFVVCNQISIRSNFYAVNELACIFTSVFQYLEWTQNGYNS